MAEATNIHTEFHNFLNRGDKEQLLGQTGRVIWMSGLSGSGKSTIANATERKLHEQGRFTIILDGDNLRSGLNSNLGFTDEDRQENIRRTAHMAKAIADNGVIVFVSLITPKEQFRQLAREIIGDDLTEIYVKASFEACAQRDVKGLYAKAAKGEIPDFSGKDSGFEEPQNADLVIDTEGQSIAESSQQLLKHAFPNFKVQG